MRGRAKPAFDQPVSHRDTKGEDLMDADYLRSIPLFSTLSEKALHTVAVFASETSVSEGKRLVHEGDYSYDLIVIDSGTADVISDGRVIASLGPGDVFGEIGMLTGEKRNADVVATSRMHLITLSKWDLRRVSDEIGEQLQALVAQRRGASAPPENSA
jgi:CRP-like cAMP-binding protein